MNLFSIKSKALALLLITFCLGGAAGLLYGSACGHDHAGHRQHNPLDEDYAWGRGEYSSFGNSREQGARYYEGLKNKLLRSGKTDDDAVKRELVALDAKIKECTEAEASFGHALKGALHNSLLKGQGVGSGAPIYHSIAAAFLGAAVAPLNPLISESVKPVWSRMFARIGKTIGSCSNLFFASSTFTVRELDCWKTDVRNLVQAFENAYKKASGAAAGSHALSIRALSSFDAESGAESGAAVSAQVVVEDPALTQIKSYCSANLGSIMAEIAFQKSRSKSDKPLLRRIEQLEFALKTLNDLINKQTALSELNSVATHNEILFWRDLIVASIDSVISATDAAADVKVRPVHGGYPYGAAYGG